MAEPAESTTTVQHKAPPKEHHGDSFRDKQGSVITAIGVVVFGCPLQPFTDRSGLIAQIREVMGKQKHADRPAFLRLITMVGMHSETYAVEKVTMSNVTKAFPRSVNAWVDSFRVSQSSQQGSMLVTMVSDTVENISRKGPIGQRLVDISVACAFAKFPALPALHLSQEMAKDHFWVLVYSMYYKGRGAGPYLYALESLEKDLTWQTWQSICTKGKFFKSNDRALTPTEPVKYAQMLVEAGLAKGKEQYSAPKDKRGERAAKEGEQKATATKHLEELVQGGHASLHEAISAASSADSDSELPGLLQSSQKSSKSKGQKSA